MTVNGTRRVFLACGVTGASLLLAGGVAQAAPKKERKEEVTPNEDLMREHGVLRRILLVYGEAARRIDGGEVPSKALTDSAGLVRRFVEDYHERMEEQFLFPRFEKAGKEGQLVKVLRDQHDAGRRVTTRVLELSAPNAAKTVDAKRALAESLRAFIRMYEPHAAREDTVLFPAFHTLVGERDYRELGERMEAEEHRRFGEGGFERAVQEVAEIEKALGIFDLAAFTPR